MVEELFRRTYSGRPIRDCRVEERRAADYIFYHRRQPGDTGLLRWDGGEAKIVDSLKAEGGDVLHVLATDAPRPAVGTAVHAVLDWERRYRHMRMHTALHVMSAVIKGSVTGGQVGADKSRLDFNLEGDVPAKEWVTEEINRILGTDRPVAAQWITDEEMNSRPELVKTMSVRPPMGAGRVRRHRGSNEACGGTHVAAPPKSAAPSATDREQNEPALIIARRRGTHDYARPRRRVAGRPSDCAHLHVDASPTCRRMRSEVASCSTFPARLFRHRVADKTTTPHTAPRPSSSRRTEPLHGNGNRSSFDTTPMTGACRVVDVPRHGLQGRGDPRWRPAEMMVEGRAVTGCRHRTARKGLTPHFDKGPGVRSTT